MAAYVNQAANPALPIMLEVVLKLQVTMSEGPDRFIFNIFHFRYQSGPGAASLSGFAGNFVTWVNSPLMPVLNARASAIEVAVRPLDDPLNPGIAFTAGLPTAGGISTDSYDLASAVSVDLLTSGRGRAFRGRKHFAPLSEADTTDDELSGAPLTNWQAMAASLGAPLSLSDGGGNTYNLTVLSRQNSQLDLPSVTFTGADVTGARLQVAIGTMRKRKIKGTL